jgi:hypothetical protein
LAPYYICTYSSSSPKRLPIANKEVWDRARCFDECDSLLRPVIGAVLDDLENWVQTWVQSTQMPAKTVYYDAAPGKKNQYVRTSASVSGPRGRRFESSRPDHSSKRALSKIMLKGFLYVAETLTAFNEKFENINLSNLAFSTRFCEMYSECALFASSKSFARLKPGPRPRRC